MPCDPSNNREPASALQLCPCMRLRDRAWEIPLRQRVQFFYKRFLKPYCSTFSFTGCTTYLFQKKESWISTPEWAMCVYYCTSMYASAWETEKENSPTPWNRTSCGSPFSLYPPTRESEREQQCFLQFSKKQESRTSENCELSLYTQEMKESMECDACTRLWVVNRVPLCESFLLPACDRECEQSLYTRFLTVSNWEKGECDASRAANRSRDGNACCNLLAQEWKRIVGVLCFLRLSWKMRELSAEATENSLRFSAISWKRGRVLFQMLSVMDPPASPVRFLCIRRERGMEGTVLRTNWSAVRFRNRG